MVPKPVPQSSVAVQKAGSGCAPREGLKGNAVMNRQQFPLL
jgi:hypothetical protein